MNRLCVHQNINSNIFCTINNRHKTNKKLIKNNENLSANVIKLGNINSKFAMVHFGANIVPARRLCKSNYVISEYIKEISKARWFHGDRAVIDLSMGNPDLTPPEKAKEALKLKVNDLWSHRYNSPKGEGTFLKTVSDWMKQRFNLNINPKDNVMVTSGAADAIDQIFSAYANVGDKILIPNPGYALYDDLITKHDLKASYFNLKPENGYLPNFEDIAKENSDAKIMILNYPHNPTGCFANKNVFDNAVKFAKENGILLIHDMDNSEITHSGTKPIGLLESEGAIDVGFQIHTLSKAQSMPGLRIAFAVSNKEFIDNLLKAKFLSGGSVYTPVQAAAVEALKDTEKYIDKVNKIYHNRKNVCVERLKKIGCDIKPSDGTYYLWAKIPPEFTSDEFYKYVLHKSQIALTPGTVFGANGEGYTRIVLSADEKDINRAFDSIEKAGIRFDVPKSKLPIDLQEEIKQMANGKYYIKPKADRDFDNYTDTIQNKIKMFEDKFIDKSKSFELFMPKIRNISDLPRNILKDGQYMYLQNVREGRPLYGQVEDITIFSETKYKELTEEIKNEWLPYAKNFNQKADILPVYKTGKFYSDATYFILRADNKLQAIANLEIQPDNCLWVRCLNSAPWNQGKNGEIRGSGTTVMARMVSFCLETGNSVLKLATDKQENINFYKKLGMKEDGIRNINGIENVILYFDEAGMKEFLNKYQPNLSY